MGLSETSNTPSIRTRDGAVTEEGFVPEWELHPEKFRYYLVGNPGTRFAITKNEGWGFRLPWHHPRGGWRIGRWIVWWSK